MKKTAICLLFLLSLFFIWFQSFLSPILSCSESGFVYRIVKPVLDFIFGSGNISHEIFRKMAHYMEYGILGLLVFNMLYKNLRQFFLSILLCLLFAFIDESIQYFVARGPSIMDVWIDLSGSVIGILVALF